MMNNTKIVFFDIDGTLLNYETLILSEKTIEVLHGLQERDIKICIATGRAPSTIPKFEGIEFDAYLTFNGSYCYTKDGEEIFNNPIAREDVKQLLRNAENIDKPVSIAVRSRLAANGSSPDLEAYYTFASLKLEIAEDFDEVVEHDDVYQVMLACSQEEHEKMLQNVDTVKITGWWDKAIDIIPGDGGKGRGIEEILAYYGFDKSESMAFGDGGNDIEMLQTVGIGIAMENAKDEVKAIADDVCGHVAEDGIYHYCVEHHLI